MGMQLRHFARCLYHLEGITSGITKYALTFSISRDVSICLSASPSVLTFHTPAPPVLLCVAPSLSIFSQGQSVAQYQHCKNSGRGGQVEVPDLTRITTPAF